MWFKDDDFIMKGWAYSKFTHFRDTYETVLIIAKAKVKDSFEDDDFTMQGWRTEHRFAKAKVEDWFLERVRLNCTGWPGPLALPLWILN